VIQEWDRLLVYSSRASDGKKARIAIDMGEVVAVSSGNEATTNEALEVFFHSGISVLLVASYDDFVRDWSANRYYRT
jgi:hypothetical protein